MSVSVDDGGKSGRKSVDVELNIVPFIDMMSCMVAFLLISAVWTNHAQIDIKPKGMRSQNNQQQDQPPPVNCSVLITPDTIWIGLTTGDRRQVRKVGEDYDWTQFETSIAEIKGTPLFAQRTDIEVGAEDRIPYQAIVSAMDSAIAKGFVQVGYMDPGMMSVKFKQ
jgi:biopolymer transport protein TolR